MLTIRYVEIGGEEEQYNAKVQKCFEKVAEIFGGIKRICYLCTRNQEMMLRFGNHIGRSFGSLGEWLKPVVC